MTIDVRCVELTALPIADDSQVLELYADGIARIERLGPNFRVTYYTFGRAGGTLQCIPVVKITRPMESLLSLGRGLLGTLTDAVPMMPGTTTN